MAAVIKIAAAILMRCDGRTLLVRKRGTTAFMQPGGKIDGDETPVEALCRELAEEIAVTVSPDALRPLGRAEAIAANEAGHRVVADLFRLDWTGPVSKAAEIAELLWFDCYAPPRPPVTLAPLTRDHVLPLVASWTAPSG